MPPKKLKCPWCGGVVWSDQSTLRIAHKVPECPKFTQAVRQTGGSEAKYVLLDETTGKVEGEGEP